MDCVTPIPKERWDSSLYFDSEKGKLGKSYCSAGGFIEGVECFDPLFFHIAPSEAERMDPQERLFLQCVYETLEDAGYTREALKHYGGAAKGCGVGVFVGVMYEEYQLFAAQAQALGQPFALSGNPSLIANRVSHFFNFQGPSIALDTMCSSSLTAIHLACQSLQRDECTFAIAGGVNVSIHPNKYLALSQGRFASSRGKCESFGEGGDGYVPGEGIGAVLLKPLSLAVQDGDQIYGVIAATAINHGGRTNGFSVPNPSAQAEVIARAIRQSGLPARAISYIESHGTGTKLGDPIEIAGLSKAFSEFTTDTQFCAIGSAKSNIGHCESAAGIAGLTKILLQMKHGSLAPSLHADTLNPFIDFAETPFTVQTKLADWRRPTLEISGLRKQWPRIAGLSSFGAGGSNAHVIIQEFITPEQHAGATTALAPTPVAIVLSARSHEQLQQQVGNLLHFLETEPIGSIDLEQVAYTLQIGREAMDHRFGCVASDLPSLQSTLRAFLDGKSLQDVVRGEVKRTRDSLAVLDTDEEMQDAVGKWIQRRKYARLLDLWARGLTFDWNRLYSAARPRRISLPTYPFANDRYWIPDLIEGKTVTVTSGAVQLHPLLHVNTSTLAEQRFTSHFTGEEFFFKDHQVQGARMLPGAAYLEMALAALRLATDRTGSVALKDVVWLHPFVMTAEPLSLECALFEDRFGQVGFEIYTRNHPLSAGGSQSDEKADGETVNARGSFHFHQVDQPAPLDLDALRACCGQRRTNAEQIYELHQALGISYGPAHRALLSLAQGTDQNGAPFLMAEINLPSVIANTYQDFELHPALIDSALHASLGWIDAEDSGDPGAARTWVPFALEEVRVFHRCPQKLWVVIRQQSASRPNVRKSNYDLCDAEGRVCVQLRGFMARPIEKQTPEHLAPAVAILHDSDPVPETLRNQETIEAAANELAAEERSESEGQSLPGNTITFLKSLLSSTFKVPAKLIAADSPLEEYGIDSVMVMQLTQELETTFGPLSKTLFFEYQTLEALAGYLIGNHRERLLQVVSPAPQLPGKTVDRPSRSAPAAMSQVAPGPLRRRRKSHFEMAAPTQSRTVWQEIAIIGVAGRYPQARDLAEYWENLKAGKDCITEIPSDRWDLHEYFDPEKGKPGKTYSKWGGFIDGVAEFDPLFFNISPREAEGMDPQERLFLQCAYHTLQDAGYTRDSLAPYRGAGLDSNVGVFVGVMYEEYQLLGAQAQAIGFPFALPGNPSSIANRVSYYLNLHGPSMALDTMCSSSLTAIHLACESLQRGGCELAIAGGVNVCIHPNKYLTLAQGRFFSSLGRCESFGEGGDGFVPGEGVGAVLLKPLAAAIADGDRIQGVIKATAINHGGKTNGYSVPNPVAQASVIAKALEQSGIPPRAVSYVEAHGTGTILGDPIEMTGLCKAFGHSGGDKQFCTLGSAKSNIGHCESAAGIAGLTKVLLQMKHRTFVPSLHAESLNPHIDFASSPFVVQRQESAWTRPIVTINGEAVEYPRIAGLSSFGAGGSNAHMLIEEYLPAPSMPHNANPADHPPVILLSARTETQLLLQVENLVRFIEQHNLDNDDLENIAYTLQVGREPMEYRVAIVAATVPILLEKLRRFAAGDNAMEGLSRGVSRRGTNTTELFQADEDLHGAVETWIEKGKLGRLAEVWAQGLAIDWSRIYRAVKPQRIALPLYPFAQDRYWVLEPGVSLTSSSFNSGGNAVLHPLLHQNISNFHEQRFASVFHGREFFLRDHHVGGAMVLPGVVYLEMARAAVHYSRSHSDWNTGLAVSLKNIAWTQPFEVRNDDTPLHIALHPRESGDIAFQISSHPALREGEAAVDPVRHAQGEIILEAEDAPPSVELDRLRDCLDPPINLKQFYELHRSMGIEYGPAFQVIQSVAAGSDPEGSRFVMAELRLPPAMMATHDRYGLHPSLLDGALHASLALFVDSDSPQPDGGSSSPWLPFAMDELIAFTPSPTHTWVLIRESSPSGSYVRKLDLQLCDEAGKPWAVVKGFAARKLESLAQPAAQAVNPTESAAATTKTMTFTEEWLPAPLPAAQNVGPRTVICFLSGNEARYAAAQTISKLNPRTQVIFVAAGDNYLQASPHDFRVAQHDPASMAEAFRAIEKEHGSLDALLYLWPLETGDVCDAHRPIQALIQAVASTRLRCPRILLGAQCANELDRCYADSWIGFERSLRLITLASKWNVIACHTPAERPTPLAVDIKQWMRRIWDELRSEHPESVFYSGETRYALRLQPTELPRAISPLRDHGTYLITGGAGGLGLLLARHLARSFTANLVLIGRSPLDEAKAAMIRELEQLGGTVLYQSADVSDAVAMALVLANSRKRFGSIDGVIHCAGLQRKESIVDNDAASFCQVLAPKVKGSLVLDELLHDEPLDFVAYFSSSAAILGDFGSCSYAVANRFQNALARYRNQQVRPNQRSRRTIAIDWPLWKNGGMSVGDDQMTEFYLQSSGQRALESEEGMLLFEQLLADSRPVQLVMVGDPIRVRRLVGFERQNRMEAAPLPVTAPAPLPVANGHMEKTAQPPMASREASVALGAIDYLTTLLSSQLRLTKDLIGQDTPFEQFGIDSVMVMELTGELEQKLGSLPKTLFFEYPSVQALAGHLVRKYPAQISTLFGRSALTEAGPVTQTLPPASLRNNGSFKLERRTRFTGGEAVLPQVASRNNRDIAIIGLSGRYPQAENTEELWANLKQARDCVTEIPSDRWDHSLYFDPNRRAPGKSYSKWGGFIADVDCFDPLFFNISPLEARAMDPQERVFLETVWALLESAGETRQTLRNKYAGKVGVYVGSMYHEYGSIGLRSAIANRVSYFFGFEGASLVVDTMCSSSAVAIHNACVDLLNGDCRVAIAGGVNLSTHPIKYVSLSQVQLLGSHSNSRSFGEGDGYVPAEGVGAVLLKPLQHAIQDGDDIMAVIKATAINHNGRSNGYSVPNPNAQAQLIAETLQKAGVDPRSVSYVEAAANGSPLGDPIEMAALEKAFALPEGSHPFCAIGSVKSNLGHPEAVSGMAQLSKVILQMRHRQLVPSINAEPLNPNLRFAGSPFYLQQELTEWKRPTIGDADARQQQPRRAVLNSFGAGGSNACIVLEEFALSHREAVAEPPTASTPLPSELVVLSARSEDRLRAVAHRMLNYLKREPSVSLRDLAFTLQTCREAMNYRMAMVVKTRGDLVSALEAYCCGSLAAPSTVVHDVSSRSSITALIDGKAGEVMLESITAERQLEKLALMWAHGARVPWSSLPRDGRPRIIPLPTYPFERVRMASAGVGNLTAAIHPPVHPEGESDDLAPAAGAPAATIPWLQKSAGVAPRTDLEIAIAEVWEGALGIKGIGVNDCFLDLGGSSISGSQIIAGLQDAFGIELPLDVLLGSQATIEGLAVAVVSELLKQNYQPADGLDDQVEAALQN